MDSPNYWEGETTTPPTLVTMLPSVSSCSKESRCLTIRPMYGWLMQNSLTDATYCSFICKQKGHTLDRHNPDMCISIFFVVTTVAKKNELQKNKLETEVCYTMLKHLCVVVSQM